MTAEVLVGAILIYISVFVALYCFIRIIFYVTRIIPSGHSRPHKLKLTRITPAMKAERAEAEANHHLDHVWRKNA